MAAAPDPKTDARLTVAEPAASPMRMQVSAGVAALRTHPAADAAMTSQALHGEIVHVHREEGEFGFIQCERDRYTGWVSMDALSAPAIAATHKVSALRTYAYPEPDLKTPPHYLISLGAEISGTEQEGTFLKDARGRWITTKHLVPIDTYEDDPAAVAERFVGTPYLWGGRESLGLDCSGLTGAAFGACGVLLPRDSDMQFAWAGTPIENWNAPGKLQRGDLVFWKGHVGIMLDSETLVHSNAYHMATAKEPLAGAIQRIAKHYGEPIGARRINISEGRHRPDWMGV